MNAGRIKYIDLLKVIAIFAVISIHCRTFVLAEVLHLEIFRLKHVFLFAVPIFLMVTGALTLNKNIKLDSFFKNRLKRIVYPLIFFTIIFNQTKLNIIFIHYWYS